MAVILYDPQSKVGGIVHALLPSGPQAADQGGKYADTGTRRLFKEMTVNGAAADRVFAKLVGGAQMFKFFNVRLADIGQRNVQQARKTLRELNVRIAAEDVGGDRGRSALLDSATGCVTVKKTFSTTRII